MSSKYPAEAKNVAKYGTEMMFNVDGCPERLSVSIYTLYRNFENPVALYDDRDGQLAYWPVSHAVIAQLRSIANPPA